MVPSCHQDCTVLHHPIAEAMRGLGATAAPAMDKLPKMLTPGCQLAAASMHTVLVPH
jgi:hypothetical protein